MLNKTERRQAVAKISKLEGFLVPGQENALMVLASTLKKNSTVVEIGSFKGRSTACFALASHKTTKVYAIDTFGGNDKDFLEGIQFKGGSFYNKFKSNLKSVDVFYKVKPIRGISSEIGKSWKKPIDLLFIDGSHIYEDVKKDFELFYPWVKPGGLVLLHDVDTAFPGVLKVWNEMTKHRLSSHGKFFTLRFGFKPKTIFSKVTDVFKIISIIVKMI